MCNKLRALVLALLLAAPAGAQTGGTFFFPTATTTSADGSVQFVSGTLQDYFVQIWGALISLATPPGDVRRFGARCNGTTDDTVAIQNAANVAGEVHIPSGTCLTDQINIVVETHWTCAPGGVLKLRSVPQSNTSILHFTTGTSDDSSVEGCEFDGNRATHTASYPANGTMAWSGIQVDGGKSRIKILDNYFHDFVRFALNVGSGFDHKIHNNVVKASGNCLLFQNSQGSSIHDLTCEDIGNTLEAYQHANEIRDCHGCDVGSIYVRNFHPSTTETGSATPPDPVPNAVQFDRMTKTAIHGIYAYNYTGTDPDGSRCVPISNISESSVSDIHCEGYAWGLSLAGVTNTTFSDSTLDGNYQDNPEAGDFSGILLQTAGVYPTVTGGGGNVNLSMRANSGARGVVFSNIIVKRFELGVLVSGGHGIHFNNVRSTGNVRFGFNLRPQTFTFPGSVKGIRNVTFSNCVAEHNGQAGLNVSDGATEISWNGGSISDNGQNYRAESVTKCSNAKFCSGVYGIEGDTISISNARIKDRQGALKTDAISFEPGAAVDGVIVSPFHCSYDAGNDCDYKVVSMVDPRDISIGQRITLKDAGGAGVDLDALVYDFCDGSFNDPLCDASTGFPPSSDRTMMDEVILETPASFNFVAHAGILTALAGTFSTGETNCGTTVYDENVICGAGSALDTAIIGRTWVTDGVNYRQIVDVYNATTGILFAPFPSPLSGASLSKLAVDVDTNPSQEYAVVMDATVTGSVNLSNLDIAGNKQADPINDATGLAAFYVSGLQPPQFPAINAATTTTLPAEADFITVNGATAITSITASYATRVVTLTFGSTADLTDGSNLKLAGSLTDDTAGRTIVLRSDGVDWHELSRSVN